VRETHSKPVHEELRDEIHALQDSHEIISAVAPHDRTWVTRATRFEVSAVLRYRIAGEQQWLRGRTENISRTGVLFLAEHPLKVHSAVRMRLELPPMKWSEFRAEIACAGLIVREITYKRQGGLYPMVASIARYRFVRRLPKPASADI
jgi:hypothetical protein